VIVPISIFFAGRHNFNFEIETTPTPKLVCADATQYEQFNFPWRRSHPYE
jgi:hypothetical protein